MVRRISCFETPFSLDGTQCTLHWNIIKTHNNIYSPSAARIEIFKQKLPMCQEICAPSCPQILSAASRPPRKLEVTTSESLLWENVTLRAREIQIINSWWSQTSYSLKLRDSFRDVTGDERYAPNSKTEDRTILNSFSPITTISVTSWWCFCL